MNSITKSVDKSHLNHHDYSMFQYLAIEVITAVTPVWVLSLEVYDNIVPVMTGKKLVSIPRIHMIYFTTKCLHT